MRQDAISNSLPFCQHSGFLRLEDRISPKARLVAAPARADGRLAAVASEINKSKHMVPSVCVVTGCLDASLNFLFSHFQSSPYISPSGPFASHGSRSHQAREQVAGHLQQLGWVINQTRINFVEKLTGML